MQSYRTRSEHPRMQRRKYMQDVSRPKRKRIGRSRKGRPVLPLFRQAPATPAVRPPKRGLFDRVRSFFRREGHRG